MCKTLLISILLVASTLSGATIVSPISGVVNTSGPGFGSLADTLNQNGLLTNFVSGVTNFDTYIATNPLHSLVFFGNEWFSNQGATTAMVTYDLGSTRRIDRLALWNEDSSGIGLLNLFYSTDNITFTSLVSNIIPTDHAVVNYAADVISFGGAVDARYVRFDMSNCPQPNGGSFVACAIGEVAFSEVPEPSSMVMFGLGLAALVGARFRRS